LKEGGVALLPTDTLYGLHGVWDDPKARHRILALKGKPAGASLLCLIGSLRMLEDLALEIPPAASRLISERWPGPLTLVLPAGPRCPPALVVDGGIALRMPGVPFLVDLVNAVGAPLLSTSANVSGSPPASSLREIPRSWPSQIDAIVDDGPRTGPPSDLIRVRAGGVVEVLRQGEQGAPPMDPGSRSG
jgi:L-threonylcarbamoyladenylate synthase